MTQSSPDTVQFATARVGAILVNVNPAYRTDEMRYALSPSGVRLLYTAARHRSTDYHAMLAEARPLVGRSRTRGDAR